MLKYDVAVIGIGCRLPQADSLYDLNKNLLDKKVSIRDITPERAKLHGIRNYQTVLPQMAYLDDIDCFDNKFFGISNAEAKNMSPEKKIALETAVTAIYDAGYSLNKIKGANCGVVASQSAEFYRQRIKDKNSLSYVGNLAAMTSGNISYYLDLRGPNMEVSATCSSSLVAVHEAVVMLNTNQADMMLAGGVNIALFTSESEIAQLGKLGILSHSGKCRSLDKEADGTMVGEGCGFVLLKRLDDAKKDNDHIYGVIKGSAVRSSGRRSASKTTPDADAMCEVILSAWKNAGITADDITEFEAHATGTPLGDAAEMNGMIMSLKSRQNNSGKVMLSALKPNFGLASYAAGVSSLIKVLTGFQYHTAYPIAGFEESGKATELSGAGIIPLTSEQAFGDQKRVVGISGFGFTGTNAHVVLENYSQPTETSAEADRCNNLIKISAADKQSFDSYVKTLAECFARKKNNFNDVVYTLNSGRDDYKWRKMFVCKNLEDFVDELDFAFPFEAVSKPVVRVIYKDDTMFDRDGMTENCKLFAENLTICNGSVEKAIVGTFRDLGIRVINSETKETVENSMVIVIGPDESGDSSYDNAFQCNDYDAFESILAVLYNSGANINWNRYYTNTAYKKVSLPAYSFSKHRNWIDYEEQESKNEPEIKKEAAEKADAAADKSKLHEVLEQAWQSVLETDEKIDYDESFFDLGGNSLLASMMFEELYNKSGVVMMIGDIYEHDTINSLYDYIESKK